MTSLGKAVDFNELIAFPFDARSPQTWGGAPRPEQPECAGSGGQDLRHQ